MITSYLLVAILFGGDTFAFRKGVQLAAPSESSPFLQSPDSFDVDGQGDYYLIDSGAKVVFKWDKSGSFIGTIGRPGNGPGEFDLRNRKGFLSIVGDRLFVFDSRKAAVSIFELDGTFLKSVQLSSSRFPALNFAVTRDLRFVLQSRTGGDDGLHLVVETYDSEGNPHEKLADISDTSLEIGFQKKQRTIHAFHPTMVTSFQSDQILIGYSERCTFQVFDLKGNSCTNTVPLERKPVSQEDIEEFKQENGGGPRPPTLKFPEIKSCYTHAHALGDKGFLVYNQSPYKRKISGVWLDHRGQLQGRFDYHCGIDGHLLSSMSRILSVTLTPQDEFVLVELLLP